MNTVKQPVILETHLKNVPLISRGKVRDIYDLGDRLLIVATDRISAFDCILPNGIAQKGRVLTAISEFWFSKLSAIPAHHLISTNVADFPESTGPDREALEGRTMLVRRTQPVLFEAVVRGYLAGSGWKDYKRTGAVCGISLPEGLVESDRLPEPIFTPATKADSGHDENVSIEVMREGMGAEMADRIKDLSLGIYQEAVDYARERGIIIADTKFEWGLCDDGSLLLIDEVLTPDSSRFWPADQYTPGCSQPSFDKQYVRDYLETCDWDKTPPAPKLPEEVAANTTKKYVDAYQRLTGREWS